MFDGRLEALIVVPSGITISATNSGGGPTSVSITAGTYTPTTFVAHVVARLNAVRTPANWTGSLSTTTGLVTLNCTGTWAITWTSTAARDMLGFTANTGSVSSAQTGTLNHRGLWLPDCPLVMMGPAARAPIVTDTRRTRGPTGFVVTYCGNSSYQHRELSWSHVPNAKAWEGAASLNGSFEQWLRDTQYGLGHAWFTRGSGFHIWDHSGTKVGSDLNAGAGPNSGWKITQGVTTTEMRRSANALDLMWRVEIPEIGSDG